MIDTPKPESRTTESDRAQSDGPPDPEKCRARNSGFGDCVDCLSDRAPICEYAFSFGCGYYCRHPKRREIVLRTLTDSFRSRD